MRDTATIGVRRAREREAFRNSMEPATATAAETTIMLLAAVLQCVCAPSSFYKRRERAKCAQSPRLIAGSLSESPDHCTGKRDSLSPLFLVYLSFTPF